MKAIILQHASFEKPGYITTWLENHNFSIKTIHVYQKNIKIPTTCQADILIIMGGPMSVHDEKKYPWVVQEKHFIKNAIEQTIPTLGICLGAQLIADIYKANVKPALQKEIGWFPIHTYTLSITQTLQWPKQLTSYLWHGEQFDIPHQAILLAHSQACPHQAFIMRNHVIGLQFHPEMTLDMIEEMIEYCFKNDKIDSPFVQTIEQMLSVPTSYFQQNHHFIHQILSYLLKRN